MLLSKSHMIWFTTWKWITLRWWEWKLVVFNLNKFVRWIVRVVCYFSVYTAIIYINIQLHFVFFNLLYTTDPIWIDKTANKFSTIQVCGRLVRFCAAFLDFSTANLHGEYRKKIILLFSTNKLFAKMLSVIESDHEKLKIMNFQQI